MAEAGERGRGVQIMATEIIWPIIICIILMAEAGERGRGSK